MPPIYLDSIRRRMQPHYDSAMDAASSIRYIIGSSGSNVDTMSIDDLTGFFEQNGGVLAVQISDLARGAIMDEQQVLSILLQLFSPNAEQYVGEPSDFDSIVKMTTVLYSSNRGWLISVLMAILRALNHIEE